MQDVGVETYATGLKGCQYYGPIWMFPQTNEWHPNRPLHTMVLAMRTSNKGPCSVGNPEISKRGNSRLQEVGLWSFDESYAVSSSSSQGFVAAGQ